jgi:hypothetical protein
MPPCDAAAADDGEADWLVAHSELLSSEKNGRGSNKEAKRCLTQSRQERKEEGRKKVE